MQIIGGQVGVILVNFGEGNFELKMGDKIPQLTVEKIKARKIVEVDSLEKTVLGDKR